MINKRFFILKAFFLVNSVFGMKFEGSSIKKIDKVCVIYGIVSENNSDKSEECPIVSFDLKNSSFIVKISEKACGSKVGKIEEDACSYFEKNASLVQNSSRDLKGEKVKFVALFTVPKKKNKINYRLAQNQDMYFQSGNRSVIRGFPHIKSCVDNSYSAQLPRKFVIATFGVWSKLCSCEFQNEIDKFEKVDKVAKELVKRAREKAGNGKDENRTAIVLSIWEDES